MLLTALPNALLLICVVQLQAVRVVTRQGRLLSAGEGDLNNWNSDLLIADVLK